MLFWTLLSAQDGGRKTVFEMAKGKSTSKKAQRGRSLAVAGPRRPKTIAHGGADHALVARVCSQLDPFCVAAKGAKQYDGSSLRSIPVSCRGYLSLQTDANGMAIVAFGMDPFKSWRAATTIAGQVPTAWGGANAYSGMIGTASTTKFRLVSGGVSVRSITSSMTNQGVIGIGVLPQSASFVTLGPLDVNKVTEWPENIRTPVKDPRGLTAFVKNDNLVAREFTKSPAVAGSDITSHGTTPLVVYCVGSNPSTAIAHIEYVFNYEVTFDVQDGLYALATPANPDNSLVQSVTNDIRAGAKSVINGTIDTLKQTVHHYAKTVLRQVLVAGATYYGGPAGGALAGAVTTPMIMDVD